VSWGSKGIVSNRGVYRIVSGRSKDMERGMRKKRELPLRNIKFIEMKITTVSGCRG